MPTRKPGRRRPTRKAESEMADIANIPTARADMHTYIGRQLRAVYDEIVSQPIPDNLVRLLEDLDQKKPDKS
jgi:Anti-sigma factor NepR